MRFYFLPWDQHSQGCKTLSEKLNAPRILLEGSRFQHNAGRVVINWGSGTNHPRVNGLVLNKPQAVSEAINKLRSLQTMASVGVNTVEFTTDRAQVLEWMARREPVVFCRTQLRSSEGRGIVIAKRPDDVVPAPLYTYRFPKKTEFRVHVAFGEVIDVTEKRLRNGWRTIANRSEFIRNTSSGWVFCHNAVNISAEAKQQAVKAVAGLSLDFGAVDLAVNSRGDIKVFEVNTAPGLECTETIDAYVTAFNNYKNRANNNALPRL